MILWLYLLTYLVCALTCSARAIHNGRSLVPRAGSLEKVTDFGDNPSNVGMYIYVPTNLAPNPAIIVAIHYCAYSSFYTLHSHNINHTQRHRNRPSILPRLPLRPTSRNTRLHRHLPRKPLRRNMLGRQFSSNTHTQRRRKQQLHCQHGNLDDQAV